MAVPRYLFRTYSPGSDGSDSSERFDSQAVRWNQTSVRTLDNLERKRAKAMIRDHVLWTSGKRPAKDDILISFTSSFLFAVQHGLRKIAMSKIPGTSYQGQTTDRNCFIAILDTRRFPTGTFRWTVDLLQDYNIGCYPNGSRDSRFLHKNHKGEYLAEFSLNVAGKTRHVSFEDLDPALYAIAPDLHRYEDEASRRSGLLVKVLDSYRSGRRVEEEFARTCRRGWWKEDETITEEDRIGAEALAQCFGGTWYIPMAAWGLAMKNGTKESLDKQLDLLLPQLARPKMYLYDGGPLIADAFREVEEWQKIMVMISRCYKQREEEEAKKAKLEKEKVEKDKLEKERAEEDELDNLNSRFGKIKLAAPPASDMICLACTPVQP